MRDGMPGPGWWIASDGRWYPPELHPDVSVPAAVAVAEAPSATTPFDDSIRSFNISHDLSVASGTDLEHIVDGGALKNGSDLAHPVTPQPVTPYPLTRERVFTGGRPRRLLSGRHAPAIALALGTLVVIVVLARGHDVRPSLNASVATTLPSAPGATDATSGQPGTTTPATAAPGATAATGSATTNAPQAGTAPATSSAQTPPRVVSVFDVVKGNCLDGASLTDGLVTTIRVVDCREVHTHEVYYSGRYPESTFDSTKISNYANDTCLTQFASYVGIDYARSRYQYLHIVPTQESWTRDNDRDVVCVAFEEDTTITGTIAGRAQ